MNILATGAAHSAIFALNYAGTLRLCAAEIRRDLYWRDATRKALAHARSERIYARARGWKLP